MKRKRKHNFSTVKNEDEDAKPPKIQKLEKKKIMGRRDPNKRTDTATQQGSRKDERAVHFAPKPMPPCFLIRIKLLDLPPEGARKSALDFQLRIVL